MHTWRGASAWAGILGPGGSSTASLGRRKADLRSPGPMACGWQVGGDLSRESPSLRLWTLVGEAWPQVNGHSWVKENLLF